MSRTDLARILVALSLAGCNAVFGLSAIDADTDADGVLDPDDNCPTVANPDQLDSNPADDGGDACAVCFTVIGVDLDADGYDDGCDRCLGPGPRGEDIDGDGIDDGCDPCIAGVSITDSDFNRDGIGDGCEVCIDAAQTEDVDQDSLDDSCDLCLRGPPHDEDGDGHDDDCDTCPVDANAAEADGPVGALGAACAIPNATRKLFDPFTRRFDARWPQFSTGWTYADDMATVMTGYRIAAAKVDGAFRIATRVHLDPDSATGRAGITLSYPTPVEEHECAVLADGEVTMSGLATGFAPAPAVDVRGPVTLVLSAVQRPPTNEWNFTCAATDAAGNTASVTVVLLRRPWTVTLGGQGTVSFEYAEIISE